MTDFPPPTEEILETFEDIPDWNERYDFLIDLGRELPKLPEDLQNEDNIVEGCMSTVWMALNSAGGPNDQIEIQADSDSIIVKGLIVVLLSYYNQKTALEIVQSDVSDYLKQLGLNQHLSPQRRNGLFSMIKRLKELAAGYCA